jgi:uncharacterized phiE125 gp8 family phage protein
MTTPLLLPGLVVIVPPTVEPISLELAQAHLNLDVEGSPAVSDDDYWLESFALSAVRRNAERFTGIALARTQYRLTIDAFSAPYELPMPPLASVDSIKYDDPAGTETTLSTDVYRVESSRNPATLQLKAGQLWPTTSGLSGCIRIEFTAGYTDETIPQDIVAGMLLMLAHLFKNREAVSDREMFEMPMSVDWLLRPYRVRLGLA